MFGMPNLQIYGLQQNAETHGMKVTSANFLEKLIKGEVLAGTDVNRREFGDAKRSLVGIVPSNNNTHYNNNNNNNIIINNNNSTNNNNNTNSNDSTLESESTDGDSIVAVNAEANKSEDNDTGRRATVPSEILDRNSNQVIHETTDNTTTKPNNYNNNRNKLNNKTNDRKLLSNDMQRKKFIQMISFLDQQNQRLEKELAKEKKRRAEELSRIIKSLLCFEAKLKHDKKVINHQLYAKDTEISQLISLNRVLRKKCGAIDGDFEAIMNDYDKDALFCPNCRKEFYGIDFKENWTQTNKDGRIIQDDHTEHGSSSDETLSSSFYGARRSIRYTSKRTFGTFRDYMRSRCLSIDDNNLDNSEENASTLSRDESQYSYEKMNAYSRAIDRLHGVRRVGSFDADLDSENDTQRRNFSSGPDDEHSPHDEEDIFLLGKTHSCGSSRAREFSESSPKQEFETSTDDWYASASDADDADVRAKPYAYNAVNPVLECVNQILLQQSMEESLHDGPPSLESNENNSGSGSGGSNKDGTVSRKRVHFSTKNSMVHVPRDDSSSPTNIMGNSDSKDNSFNYESIYSNEYEPIGSEHNSSNLYVDMESKLSHDDRIIVQDRPKQPPALPPKPANLMKFKRVLRIVPQSCPLKEEIDAKQDEKTISEPDYCSISEVNEAITSVQIVADVHKVPEDESSSSVHSDAQSQKTDEVEEIFADIPKLPNVAAIIAPKAISKFISHDNYITKSPSPKEEISQHKPPYVPNILAEINRKISTSTPTTPTKPSPVLPQSPSKKSPAPLRVINNSLEDKLPLQAEFDWYNLDAEYGKSNQPDVIKATDVTNLDFHSEELDSVAEGNEHANHGVEYNLDEEFSLVNQPDIIKENILEPMLGPAAATVCDGFPTIVDQTPCAVQKVKVKTNFTNFIDSSGLSTKPLPRQRKIYFSGPFV